MRKRIGILTYHSVINYGAYMQALSLQQNLSKRFPEVMIEIIDFTPLSKVLRYYVKIPAWFLLKRGIKEYIQCWKKYRIFWREQKQLVKSPRHFFTDNYAKVYRYINERYDMVIVGSDAVFNDSDVKGFSPYFLHGVTCGKVSYAASAHGIRYKEYSKEKIDLLKNCFEQFICIGVRDSVTEAFVRYCGLSEKINYCCDPAFLFDMSQLKQCRDIQMQGKKTIIVMLKHEEICKKIKEWFGKEYNIIALAHENKYADQYIWDITPCEWATIFNQADLIFSEFFHGVIFSLKNLKPVIAIDPMIPEDEYQTKIRDLIIQRLNLPDMYCTYNDFAEEEKSIRIYEQCLHNMTYDYSQVIRRAISDQSYTFDKFCERLEQELERSS